MMAEGRTKLALAWDDPKRRKEVREVVEEAAAKHKISVAIHVKPGSMGKATTRKEETEAILVKRSEG